MIDLSNHFGLKHFWEMRPVNMPAANTNLAGTGGIKKRGSGTLSRLTKLACGFFIVQAFVLVLTLALPWPVVGIETWGGHQYSSITPDSVMLFFWCQCCLGLLLPIRAKAFLIIQYALFILIVLVAGEVTGHARYGKVILSQPLLTCFWVQFFFAFAGLTIWKSHRRTN